MGSVEHDEREQKVRFPVGGPRDAVFDFLVRHGFTMSEWSDKHWQRRHDGLSLHVYGAGSKARIYNKDRVLLADDALDAAMDALSKVQS